MIYWVQSMNKQFQLISLLTILVFWNVPSGFAQDDEATTTQTSEADVEETAPDSEEVPAGQEVEINEDNYRQFMELKDARQQRDMLPENSYQSQAGAQKIDKLPEESQKHLRNELREIIIQGDQWQPGDEDTDYPYVPSKTASTNQALQKQEAGAWGELVDDYHKREAEMYGNASRTKASSATAGAAGEGSGEGEGSAGVTRSINSLVLLLTGPLLFITRDTVAVETPARWATSRIVGDLSIGYVIVYTDCKRLHTHSHLVSSSIDTANYLGRECVMNCTILPAPPSRRHRPIVLKLRRSGP